MTLLSPLSLLRPLCLLLAPLIALTVAAAEPEWPDIDIPYQKHVLPNGLTLILHEDHKTPIVAVNIWYHVASKDEAPGKTGFAHLFEHLMFQGSENHNDEFFRPLEAAGATDMNGTTSEDRTNYFANVPKGALDRLLMLESDRMGHFLGTLTQAKLDEQRGVVKNEKRQRENAPYGKVWDLIPAATYPAGHPYAHTVIGSMDDLDRATLDDVRAWFKRYYGPNNATLVIAGDIDPVAVRKKVEHYFGDIPPGPPLAKQKSWIAPMRGEHRQQFQDRVPQARLLKLWNVPGAADADSDRLSLLAQVLAGGKTSRLYQRLVERDQLVTDIQAALDSRELGSQFLIIASAREGVSLSQIETVIDEELDRLQEDGATKDELARARTTLIGGFLRGLERIGGFGGKADILAANQVYTGDPASFRQSLQTFRDSTTRDLRRTQQRWLNDDVYVLEVLPFAELDTATQGADRSRLPPTGPATDLQLPALQRFTLGNGLPVRFARRSGAPVVQIQAIFERGYASDPADRQGRAAMATDMLNEGTERLSGYEFAAELERLGAAFSAGAGLEVSTAALSALTPRLGDSLRLFAEALREPGFPADALDRVRAQHLAALEQEKARPTSLALRLLPPLLFGQTHPYGRPLTGSGSKTAIDKMTVADLRLFQQQVLRPDNASLLVIGDVSESQLKAELESAFGNWRAPETAAATVMTAPAVTQRKSARIYLLDRPGAEQSTVIAGQLVPPRKEADDTAFEVANAVMGGMFMSRLNLNLREDKHWSYGAGSFVVDTRNQRPLLLYAPVQTDRTAEAMREMLREAEGLAGKKPVTPGELDAARNTLTLKLPGQHETNAAVLGTLAEQLIYGLPDDHYSQYVSRVRQLTARDVNHAASHWLNPASLTWIVVGDLSKITAPIRALNLGPVEILSAEAIAEQSVTD